MKQRVELSVSAVSSMESLTRCVKELGMNTMAVTGYFSVANFPKAYTAARHNEIKMIYGVILPVWFGAKEIRYGHEYNSYEYVTVLAKNQQGINAIYELMSMLLVEDDDESDYKVSDGKAVEDNELTIEDILAYRENLVIGTDKHLFEGQDYLTVTPYQDAVTVNETLKIGDELGITVVAVGNVSYSGPDDSLLNKILNGDGVNDNGPLLATDEMLERFNYLPKDLAEKIVIENTNLIADMVQGNIEPVCRNFDYFEEENFFAEMKSVIDEKIHEIYGETPSAEILDRIETELRYISQSRNIMPFYIAYKVCDFVHKKGCPISFRGTVANSLAAYLLGITDIDPIEFNLSYEMFFGDDGTKVADIDINVPDVLNEEVNEYINQLCGEQNVLKAGTLQIGFSYKWAYHIAEEYLSTIKKAWTPEEKDSIAHMLMNCGEEKKQGVHPCSLMIIPDDCSVYDFTPIKTINGVASTYFDYHDLQNIGLLKVDFFADATLTFLKKLSDETGTNLCDIPLDDKTTYELINTLDNEGIIGLDGDFAKDVINVCEPKCFNDLVKICGFLHGTNVWRGNIDKLVATGVVTIDNVMANREDVFDYLLSHSVERKRAYMASEMVRKGHQDKDFIYGICIEHGLPSTWADSVCKIVYMFPRAHSASIAKCAYMIAYFKANFPEIFCKIYQDRYVEIKDTSRRMTKGEAIDACMTFGRMFLDQFCILYANADDEKKCCHCLDKMQTYFDKVSNIILESTARGLLKSQLVEWFFTCGSDIRELKPELTDDSEYIYDEFCFNLMQYFDCREAWDEVVE